MRLNRIDCVKGELFHRDHILLQFTGLYDKQDEEIYEMDMVLIAAKKFVVVWDPLQNGWCLSAFPDEDVTMPLMRATAETATRICSYFESERSEQAT
jgi:hypothetical protein